MMNDIEADAVETTHNTINKKPWQWQARGARKQSNGGEHAQESPSSNISSSLSRSERNRMINIAMTYVIFPDNVWIKRWDAVIIILLVFLLFVLPFQIGVSSSVLLNFGTHDGWALFNVVSNACFFVDTFIYFFRAYNDPATGRLVFRLDKIRKRYLRTYFVPNLISCFPTALVVGLADIESTRTLLFMMVFDFFKFFRFGRFRLILQSSDVVVDFQDRFSVAKWRVLKVLLAIGMAAHWFACVWCLVAYIETEFNFTEEAMSSRPNWIWGWYEGSYTKGSINPIGEYNFMDRYVLALFWSVQTITSIGYGNISPVTRLEWWVGSVLMLFAGFAWSFLIGAIVSAIDALEEGDDSFRQRMDQAQRMIRQFDAVHRRTAKNKGNASSTSHVSHSKRNRRAFNSASLNDGSNSRVFNDADSNAQEFEEKELDEAIVNPHLVHKRILRYIHSQNQRGNGISYSETCVERYPVLETLSPELKRTACYSLLHDELENIPYLSTKYLTQQQQGRLAETCRFLEYGAGERFRNVESVENEPGLYLIQSGCALATLAMPGRRPQANVMTSGMDVKLQDFLLLEDEERLRLLGVEQPPSIHFIFLSFCKVIFIPRHAIFEAMKHNDSWKSVGRWRYLRCWLLIKKNNTAPFLETDKKEKT